MKTIQVEIKTKEPPPEEPAASILSRKLSETPSASQKKLTTLKAAPKEGDGGGLFGLLMKGGKASLKNVQDLIRAPTPRKTPAESLNTSGVLSK